MPRIAFVETYYDSLTGSQRSMLPLLTDATAYDPTLVVPAEGALSAEAARLGVPVDVVPLPSRLDRPGDELLRTRLSSLLGTTTGVARTQVTAFDYLRRRRFDALYCNSLKALLLFGPAARVLDVPVVWYVRIDTPASVLDDVGTLLADHVVTISDGTRRRFERSVLPTVETRTIYTGIDLSQFPPRDSADGRFPFSDREGPIVVEVASLVPRKGQHDLVDAVALAADSLGDFELVFAGEASDEAYKHGRDYGDALRRRVARAGIADRTTFLGWCDDVPALLAEADIFVLPSYNEGLPRSILEAFAMGVPVVATPAGGTRELVDDETGIVVPKGSPEALASALRRLGSDAALRERMGRAARNRVVEQFSLDRYVADFEQFLVEDVLASGPVPVQA